MNARFLWARLRGDDTVLGSYATPPDAVLATLNGKKVALIGNARALSETEQGAQIDAADVVVRINSAPIPSALSHGSRTTWIGMSIPVPADVIAQRQPERLIWMSPKRKRLPWRIARTSGFAFYPVDRWHTLVKTLEGRPTTGAMLIDFLASSNAASITLHGFDFFASKSLSGGRDAAAVPHDFDAEQRWVSHLLARDPRFRLIPPRP